MKKALQILSFALATVALLLTMTSCGEVKISQSNLAKYSNYYYEVSEYERYEMSFTNSTLTVDHQYYTPNSSSPSGKYLDSSRSTSRTYSYVVIHNTKDGRYGIDVNGTTYYCEFYKHSGDGYGLIFDEPFLDIGTRW